MLVIIITYINVYSQPRDKDSVKQKHAREYGTRTAGNSNR